MRILKRIVTGIDSISEWTGKTVCFLCLALVFTITVDVFMRYVFNSPTKWSYDITYMLGGTLFVMTIAFVLRYRGHVSIDIIRGRMPVRLGLAIDVTLHVLLFFPLMLVLFWLSTEHACTSIAQRELSNVGFWRPPLYPFRAVLPVAFFLVVLQGVSMLITDVCRLAGRWDVS